MLNEPSAPNAINLVLVRDRTAEWIRSRFRLLNAIDEHFKLVLLKLLHLFLPPVEAKLSFAVKCRHPVARRLTTTAPTSPTNSIKMKGMN